MHFVSGIMLGVDWILIFEAYRYASVSLATLFHYLAPVIIVAASPFVFKEKMTGKKLACIMAALLGMVFVSGVAEGGIPPLSQLKGILMAFCGAFLYATVVIANMKVHGISPYDRTLVQLAVSAIVLLIYNLLSGSFPAVRLSGLTIALLLILGCVHTGLAYCLYFSCAERLNAQTLAIYSYIDPVLALLLSALILKEDMSLLKLLGAVLVIAAALISELPERRKNTAGV